MEIQAVLCGIETMEIDSLSVCCNVISQASIGVKDVFIIDERYR